MIHLVFPFNAIFQVVFTRYYFLNSKKKTRSTREQPNSKMKNMLKVFFVFNAFFRETFFVDGDFLLTR